MPTPADLEKSGTYIFLFFLSIIAAVIGFARGLMCGTWQCSYVFLFLGLIFLIGAIRKIFFS
ncbi:MAG: hypothetical protein PHN37_02035 [Candidatus Pacebacteria bacterium]|nr:hypothetical protein [Candidatus Paceibacterota bacterium]